jgi:hypothetical protein
VHNYEGDEEPPGRTPGRSTDGDHDA